MTYECVHRVGTRQRDMALKAIIPVAGMGMRLRPHTHTTPKALMHVAGKPILAHIIDELEAVGV